MAAEVVLLFFDNSEFLIVKSGVKLGAELVETKIVVIVFKVLTMEMFYLA